MNLESLTKLAASGNVAAIEETWLGWLDQSHDANTWRDRAVVLDALARNDKQEEAVALATTTVEQLASQAPAKETVQPAAAFLLALKKSEKLRELVGNLYKDAYADTPGLESLIDEAGIYQGRPPRRAVRTLNVCLNLTEQCYLTHREEHTAAQVQKIETDPWRIEIMHQSECKSFGPVELADEFEIADSDDYRVMAEYDPDRLRKRLVDDTASVVLNILQSRGGEMTSDELAKILRGKFVANKDWTKWWTKARQALKATHRVEIEGRTPYYLTYVEVDESLEEQFFERIKRLHDAKRELAVVDEYVKACETHDQQPSAEFLTRVKTRFEQRANVSGQRSKQVDLTSLLAAAQIARLAGQDNPDQYVSEALTAAEDPAADICRIDVPAFWTRACELLVAVRPNDARDILMDILPKTPTSAADTVAQMLIDLGADASTFASLADTICRNPVEMNEGLLWLWSSPEPQEAKVDIPKVTLLTRLLNALVTVDHDDLLPPDRKKEIRSNSRDVLRAKRFERFRVMLTEIEPGMASAIRTEIARSEGLSRAVREDMLKLLRRQFPELTAKPAALPPKWLREDVLYCTQGGKRRRQLELDELVNVKIRENAIAIGEAADKGDLSENSEYKFALEERDLLHARLGQMQKEMDMAQVFTESDVSDQFIDIGTRSVLVHVDNQTRQEVTLMGPWEADTRNRIYNYQTPLAQAVLGAKLGDEIEVEYFDPPGKYRVESIHNALSAPAEAV